MSVDRRPEIISATLCTLLSVLSFWCTKQLVAWTTPSFSSFATELPGPTQYVYDVVHDPFSFLIWPWLSGTILIAAGTGIRHWRPAEFVGHFLLFLAPVAPVAMLAASAWALMTPVFSIAGAIK